MKRSWSRIFALTMGIPLLLAILAACGAGTTGGAGTTPTSGSTTIKIASDLPVSGKDASSGKPAENGAHLAVDQANAKHVIPGYTLVFDPKDDVGPSGIHDPAVGAQNVRSLIGDGLVAGIVGPFNSNVARAEMPITNQAPLAQISPANTNTCLTQEGAAIGCSGANDLVPTLRPTSEPGTTTSYVSLLTQIAPKHPDAIYFGGLDSTGGILIRQQMKQVSGLASTPLGGGDGIVTPTYASTIGIPQGPVFGTVAVIDTSKNPAAKTFVDQYNAVYSPINVYSAAAYDCANILIQAVKMALANGAHTPQNSSDAAGAKAFRQAVINAIQNISFDGVTGHQAFDKNGDTTDKIISIYKLDKNTTGKPDWIFENQVVIP